jgi:1,2-dihydroxy-3-keto-5-methylthiopentene dioxygenase
MSTLTTFDEQGKQLFFTDNFERIQSTLKKAGVTFERWQAQFPIKPDTAPEDILAAYAKDIRRLKAQGVYQSADVISLHPNHPDRLTLRQKFLSEHTHTEDEVRFFVNGQGMFYLHIGEQVHAVLCYQDDLISVPAGTPHWFDMGPTPEFTAIRLFTNPEGWVAEMTGNTIAERIPFFE